MLTVLKILGRIGLLLTILPALLLTVDAIDLQTTKLVMIIGTVLWLGMAPLVQKLNKQVG